MKIKVSVIALAISVVPIGAQEPRTGVSHPAPDVIAADQEATSPAKPSAATPLGAPTRSSQAQPETYGTYVPYRGARVDQTVPVEHVANTDGDIVTSVEERPGELREGTLLHVRMLQGLSTETTEAGTSFAAALTEAVEKDGRVILPAGAVLHGRVTAVHSGRRISGAAMLHLEAKSIGLPDGTHYPIRALLIDTDQDSHTRVDHEGSLVRRDHPKETLAAVGVAAGGAAAAGALIGGGVGAAVGAGIGAGAGTILWLKQDRQAAIPENTLLVFSLVKAMPTTPQSASAHTGFPDGPDGHVVGDTVANIR